MLIIKPYILLWQPDQEVRIPWAAEPLRVACPNRNPTLWVKLHTEWLLEPSEQVAWKIYLRYDGQELPIPATYVGSFEEEAASMTNHVLHWRQGR